jgi:hypothetical protein
VIWQHVATDKMPATDKKLTEAEKDLLRRWIVAGAPLDAADVAKADPVKAAAPLQKRGVAVISQRIDDAVTRKLREAKIPASAKADDTEFLRRVYLDVTGTVPTLQETVAFLESTDADKRAKLIDKLLASDRYGQHFAVIWHKLLIPTTTENYRALNHDEFIGWMKKGLNKGRGWNELVYDLLTPTGQVPPQKTQQQKKIDPKAPISPQGVYTLSLEIDKRIQPKLIAASSSRLFLGQSIECAQCHNHPQAKWRRADFWGVAAFFDRIRREGKQGELIEPSSRKEQVFEKKGADRKFVVPAIQSLPVIDMEDGTEKRTGKFVPAKFLDGKLLDPKTQGPFRPIFAKWATAPENPFFARAAVNRWWDHFFGAGFVNPVDEMSEDNTPSHPELLTELTQEFAASGFDLKHLIRCICNSETYQRTSVPTKENRDDKTLFSHQLPRQLTAEVLYDCLIIVVPGFDEAGPKKKAADPAKTRADFLAILDSGDASPTEYSRGLQQALRLMNGNGKDFGVNVVQDLLKDVKTPEEKIERIYLTALNRRPRAAEMQRMLEYVRRPGTNSERYVDVFWALINCGEFIINH